MFCRITFVQVFPKHNHLPNNGQITGKLHLRSGGSNKVKTVCRTCSEDNEMDDICKNCGGRDVKAHLTIRGKIVTETDSLPISIGGCTLDQLLGNTETDTLSVLMKDPVQFRDMLLDYSPTKTFSVNYAGSIIDFNPK